MSPIWDTSGVPPPACEGPSERPHGLAINIYIHRGPGPGWKIFEAGRECKHGAGDMNRAALEAQGTAPRGHQRVPKRFGAQAWAANHKGGARRAVGMWGHGDGVGTRGQHGGTGMGMWGLRGGRESPGMFLLPGVDPGGVPSPLCVGHHKRGHPGPSGVSAMSPTLSIPAMSLGTQSRRPRLLSTQGRELGGGVGFISAAARRRGWRTEISGGGCGQEPRDHHVQAGEAL